MAIALIVVAGIVLYVVGMLLSVGAAPGQESIWARIAAGLGTLVVVSGVSGAVMKILAVEGFFLDALVEGAHGRNGLSRLNEESLSRIWVDCSRLLYLQNMEPEHPNETIAKRILEARDEVERALKDKLPSSEKHFVDRHERILRIRWEDEQKAIILIDDTINSELICFKAADTLEWHATVRSEVNLPIEKESMREIECRLLNEGNQDLAIERTPSADGLTIRTRFVSSPKEKHEIYRRREWRRPILEDPNLFTITPFLVRNASVRVYNDATNLAVILMYLGNDRLFREVSGTRYLRFGQEAHVRSRTMMLPGQGYGLTFVRLS